MFIWIIVEGVWVNYWFGVKLFTCEISTFIKIRGRRWRRFFSLYAFHRNRMKRENKRNCACKVLSVYVSIFEFDWISKSRDQFIWSESAGIIIKRFLDRAKNSLRNWFCMLIHPVEFLVMTSCQLTLLAADIWAGRFIFKRLSKTIAVGHDRSRPYVRKYFTLLKCTDRSRGKCLKSLA